MNKIFQLIVLAFFINVGLSLENGVGRTPPMGWMSWERYTCETDCEQYPTACINEQLYIDMIDRIVEDGWLELGYNYVNIDDCWQLRERVNGHVIPDPDRFPHGIKYIADYAHSKGVKFGLYTDIGTATCEGYPGLQGHMAKDMREYISWGIDSIKVDGCNADSAIMNQTYPYLSQIMNATGVEVFYSCSWPAYLPPENAPFRELAIYCNSWRNYLDIHDYQTTFDQIIENWNKTYDADMVTKVHPGAFNDPDMLLIGNFGYSLAQQRTQMALWAIFAAPMMMSNDLRNIRKDSVEILQNKEIIEVDQDPLGKQGYMIRRSEGYDGWRVWVRELDGPVPNSSYAVVLQNIMREWFGQQIHFNTTMLPLVKKEYRFKARDLFEHKDLGIVTDISRLVRPQDVMMFKIVILREDDSEQEQLIEQV